MKKQANTPQKDPLYHDTWTLLRKYRDVVWSLELSVRRAQKKFEVEYGKSIEVFWNPYTLPAWTSRKAASNSMLKVSNAAIKCFNW